MTLMAEQPPARQLRLRLYVAGDSFGTRRALESRRRLLEAPGSRLVIEIVDILDDHREAKRANILVTPTLSDDATAPPRRLVGDLDDVVRVLDFFGIAGKDNAS